MKNYSLVFFAFSLLLASSCHNEGQSQVFVPVKICDNNLNNLNQGNILEAYIKGSKEQVLFNFRAVYSCTKRIQVIDSLCDNNCGDSIVPGLSSDFTRCDGATRVFIDGKDVFFSAWHSPYNKDYLEKTNVFVGASHNYAFVKIKSDHLFIISFDPENFYEFDLKSLRDENYEHSFSLIDLVYYKGNVFIANVKNGWVSDPGPHRLIAIDFSSGHYNKFLFE
ncbi:MAG: hypothetical protein WCK37_02575 [Candidatus Falkowbacteria bacterium]